MIAALYVMSPGVYQYQDPTGAFAEWLISLAEQAKV